MTSTRAHVRSIVVRSGSSLRGHACALAAGLFVTLVAPSIHAEGDPPPGPAAIDEHIAVGTELVAVADVTLRRVGLVKGSRVSVTKLSRRGGRLSSVDVELADGYVLQRVAIATVRALFRVAPEPATAR
jgi:hypothetical protein